MLKTISEAINSQQFEVAEQLLQNLQAERAENPWVEFYEARLAEAKGDWYTAKDGYRKLLPLVNNPQLIAKLRQGLDRLAKEEEKQQQQEKVNHAEELEKVKSASHQQELGIFILEAIATELKQQAAVNFAKIMQTDPYSARLQLPSRSWRLYRTGGIGELSFYQEKLQAVNVPCFCIPLSHIVALTVKPVYYFSSLETVITGVYRVNQDEDGLFEFSWSDISQRVEGLLPIFEECVDVDTRGNFARKTKILDYARVCDLHLPKHKTILRLCDQTYEFMEGIPLKSDTNQQKKGETNHEKWQFLMESLNHKLLNKLVWSEFNSFAETAMDFQELLKLIEPHMYFMRREETYWDQAFQLYSGLILCRSLLPN